MHNMMELVLCIYSEGAVCRVCAQDQLHILTRALVTGTDCRMNLMF